MINLLPPETKTEYRFARRNTRLAHWVVTMAFAFVGLVGISAGGVWYLHKTSDEAQVLASAAEESLKQQNQAQVQKQVKDISDSIKLAVQVLGKEVLFSKLLKQIAVVTPTKAKLANLTISQTQGAVDISANTTDYDAATQLQVNLADPKNKIFSKADIVSINCGGSAPGGSSTTSSSSEEANPYPCTANIRALFATDNPFLFINSSSTAKKLAQ